MESINQSQGIHNILITKGYINSYDQFTKALNEQYSIIDYSTEITSLQSLVIIKNYLSSTELNKILKGFTTFSLLSSIQKINLTANNLEAIPPSFQSLTGLKVLILNNNKIGRIEHLASMTQLEHLELRGNQIKQIEGLDSLKQLKVLTLSCNQIKTISQYDIPKLPSLLDLGLFGNYLGDERDKEVNVKLFTDICLWIGLKMKSLRGVYLGGNVFSSFAQNYKAIAKENIKSLESYDGHNI